MQPTPLPDPSLAEALFEVTWTEGAPLASDEMVAAAGQAHLRAQEARRAAAEAEARLSEWFWEDEGDQG